MILRLFSDGKFDKNTKNSQVLFIFSMIFKWYVTLHFGGGYIASTR